MREASLFDLDLDAAPALEDARAAPGRGQSPLGHQRRARAAGERQPPGRRNVKSLRGIDAITGASNFDIAEAVWLKLIEELAAERADDRAAVQDRRWPGACWSSPIAASLPIAEAAIYEIDAARWFGAAVGACLFRMTLGQGFARASEVPVFAGLDAERRTVGDGFRPGAAGRRRRRPPPPLASPRALPAHLAAGAQARRRGGHGADRRRRRPGRSATGSVSRSTSSRSSSTRMLKGSDLAKPPRGSPAPRA